MPQDEIDLDEIIEKSPTHIGWYDGERDENCYSAKDVKFLMREGCKQILSLAAEKAKVKNGSYNDVGRIDKESITNCITFLKP